MFSLVQPVFWAEALAEAFWAEAGLTASAVMIVTAVTSSSFIFFLPGRTMRPKLKITKRQKSSREPAGLTGIGRLSHFIPKNFIVSQLQAAAIQRNAVGKRSAGHPTES
ncbi:hypothetical protein [Bradyrhizobium sp. AZCC 1719]|uniref:hypothetical protein n=1 Tax=Bradyrhizobium sp. AZCC 1719 TaxID=3117028 RepID=UPI002FF04507